MSPALHAPRSPKPPSWGRIMSLLGGLASEPRTPLSNKARMKKLPKKSQNEKYRLKYLRLRKAAKATVFVSLGSAALSLGLFCPPVRRLEKQCQASVSFITYSWISCHFSSPVYSSVNEDCKVSRQ